MLRCPNLRKEFDEDGKLIPYKPTFECGIVGMQKQWAYRYLKGEALNTEIDKIVKEHTQEHKVTEVLHKLDSQNTEAGHKSYTAKRPKDRPYYGGGKSSDFRIAASAGELIDGIASYHDRVLHKELGFKSAFTNQMLGQKQKRREQIYAHKTTDARKKQRVDNRNASIRDKTQAERRDKDAGRAYAHHSAYDLDVRKNSKKSRSQADPNAPCKRCGLVGHKTANALACLANKKNPNYDPSL